MSRKTTLVLFVFTALAIIAGFWPGPNSTAELSEEHSTQEQRSADSTEERIHETPRPAEIPKKVADEEDKLRAEEISPPSWKPSAVFGEKMTPTPLREFPRGENFSRRYHDPERREIDPALSKKAPVVLAGSPQDGRLHLLQEEIDDHTLRAGRMVFNPAALNGVIEGKTSRVLAPTLDEEALTLEFEAVTTRSAHTHTLRGHVVGEESTSIAHLVYHDGAIHGSVMRYDSQQEIQYRILADAHMVVREMDHPSMTDECSTCSGGIMSDIMDTNMVEDKGEYTIGVPGQDPSNITIGWRALDVVVGYGQEARIADGGYTQIEARIIDAVDRMTLAFANSGVADSEVMLLGTIEDPDYLFSDTDDSNMGREISDLRSEGDGDLDTVTDFGNRLGADFVSFVIKQARGSTAGVASAGKYTVVSRTNMTLGRMTFSHELGHNLGCTHAWGDSNNHVDNSRYAWRFISPDSGNRYRTITAYNNGIGGSTIPYYSNPNVLFDGARTGAVDGYNVLNDPTADPIFYEENGIRGFDGSNPDLGANNAEVIDIGDASIQAGLDYNIARSTRTTFEVIDPTAGARLEMGTTRTIKFNGGDMDDLATIELYKGGVLHTTLATEVNPATHRNFAWTLPFDLTEGTDYMIRVELDSNGSTLFADSGLFEIFRDLPHVKAESTTSEPQGLGPITALALTFNFPMNPATFDAGSDIISFTDPDGASVVSLITGTSWSAGDTVLTIEFAPPTVAGTYQLVIGPEIEDIAGNPMDQDFDGTAGETVQDRHIASFEVPPPLVYFANMDTDPGWTFSANNPTDGWEFGQPTGGTGPTDGSNYNNGYGIPDPASGFNGPNAIAYNLDGDYQRGITTTRWATTPALDCGAHKNVKLRFQQWLGVYHGGTNGDNVYIQVSNDGVSWTTKFHNDNVKFDEPRWIEQEYDISDVADGQSTVYVRWGMGATNTSANNDSCGWNIDEVTVFGDTLDGILLFAPNGGESYYAGSTADLTWASALGGNVQIELLKNGIVDSTITSDTENDHSYAWQIPAGLTPGSDYRIRITSLDDPSKTAESAADFSIVSIRITSPNGGESYYAGSTANLAWVSSMGGNVRIELLKNGSVDSTITPSTANDGSLAWQIPAGQTPGSDYRIRVTSLDDPSKTAESAADFNIVSIRVTSPDGGESYYAGSTANLAWTSSMGGNVRIELLKNGSVDSTITSNTANDASFAWQIPAAQTLGSDYRIRITSLDYPSGTAESAADFAINALPSVPFSENFVSGFGDWTQESTDDFDWSRNSGGTGSADTGPSTGQEGAGDYYLYTEATGNNPGKLAQISAWFNLETATLPELSFHYHMLGTSMGTLTVDASADGLTWDPLFTRSGNQSSSWIPATVSLSDYAGGLVKLRISGTTGSGFTSDIAVDSFTIVETASTNDFATWISGYDVGTLTAFSDDFDNDGLGNGIENYFGTHPGEFSSGMVAGDVDNITGTFAFTHPLNENPAADISAAYRWSKDLSNFYYGGQSDPAGTTVTFSQNTPSEGMVDVTAAITGTDTDRVFVDIEVSHE